MAGDVDHESAADRRRNAFVRVELHHVEKVPGMLPIQCRDELAAINVFKRKRPTLTALTQTTQYC